MREGKKKKGGTERPVSRSVDNRSSASAEQRITLETVKSENFSGT